MNAIELITKWSTKAWDKVYKREAISSVLDGDKELLNFTGVKTVRIAKFASDGLSNYERANGPHDGRFGGDGHDTSMAQSKGYGYAQGDVDVSWEEFTIRCDRGKQLRIALFDDEETGGLAVGMATTEFSRTKVIPEVDAYVFSKIVENAGTVSTSTIQNSATIGYNANGPIQALNDAFLALADAEVPEEDQIIFCSNSFFNLLRSTNELVRRLDQTEYGENVKFTISEYEGRELIPVPANRFRTLINLTNDGYGWKTGSKKIDFIVCAKSAIYHVVKYDKVKVFQPNVVQDFDGYKVNIRVYHDLFVPENKKIAIYAHISGDAAASDIPTERVLNYAYDAANDILVNVYVQPGDVMATSFFATSAAQTVGSAVAAGATAVTPYVATGLSAGTYYLCAAHNGIVTAVGAASFTIA